MVYNCHFSLGFAGANLANWCHENQMALTPAIPKQPSNVGGTYEKRYFFLDNHPSTLLANASEYPKRAFARE